MTRPTQSPPTPQERKLLAMVHKEADESLEAFIARVLAATEEARANAPTNREGGDA